MKAIRYEPANHNRALDNQNGWLHLFGPFHYFDHLKASKNTREKYFLHALMHMEPPQYTHANESSWALYSAKVIKLWNGGKAEQWVSKHMSKSALGIEL